ncbi:MAG: hypothetical protein ACLR76_09600 [Alistipes sp.]
MPLVKPAGYRNLLDNVENTEKAIKLVKDMFQQNLSAQLALLRVTAPMVVLSGTGINDDLNSVERPVCFLSATWASAGPRRFTRWPSETVSSPKWPSRRAGHLYRHERAASTRSSTTFTRLRRPVDRKRSLRAAAPSLS